MAHSAYRHALTTALLLGASSLAFPAIVPAAAQSVPPSSPPATVNPDHPTVKGILVAKPVSGEGNLPSACRDADQASVNSAVLQKRGLVICTEEGKLVLLVLSKDTGIYARYWGQYSVDRLADGDHIKAWGVLGDNGHELNPTFAVQDVDIQEAYVDSQDYITKGGKRLTLDVLQSDPKGPVQGIVHAVKGGESDIRRCNGSLGTWDDLTAGKTIDISHSLFNRRLMTYIHTDQVRIVSCS